MKIINKKVSELIPYEKNAKKHPESQIKQIANSIKEFGFKQPVVIDKDNVVIVGHGRLEAAKLLEIEAVPCLLADDLTPSQVKAYRLADNKLNESDWDMDLVMEEYGELDDFLQEATTFEADDFYELDIKNTNKEIEIDDITTEHECPKCKFKF